jgi:hypothetical protein
MIEGKQARMAVDWERIEGQYRAGVLSLREIAAMHDISDTAIRKHAKAKGWERDLSAKIKAKADALVRSALVRSEVRSANQPNERTIIEANAESLAALQLTHNAHVKKARDVVESLWAEAASLQDGLPSVAEMAEILQSQDEGRMRDVVAKAVSLPSRATTAKTLVESSVRLVTLEREIRGLSETNGDIESKGRELSDLERASRLASILDRARRAKAETSDD